VFTDLNFKDGVEENLFLEQDQVININTKNKRV
jgi:hypothetical protein